MKVALVHDYIGEFGGAERVLLALSEIYPQAPIYTAFSRPGVFLDKLEGKEIRTSWAQKIPFFATKLHSPLRFLAPFIWGSFNFSEYDIVITSASWYVTKGFKKGPQTIEVCYCHTPPRYLYGYQTSVRFTKYWPVKLYAHIVNPFMRYYDFVSAQKVSYFIANSKNVQARIKKFYRRDSTVIYPPVELVHSTQRTGNRRDYYLIVARIAGAKGIELAIEATEKLNVPLKIAGAPAGYGFEFEELKKKALKNVEFLGYVEDSKLAKLYQEAKAFLALSRDEDFGMTLVESMQAGTPVIAFKAGGYLESVIEGKTGTFFDEYTVEDLMAAMDRLDRMRISSSDCKKQGEKFSKKIFQEKMMEFVEEKVKRRIDAETNSA